MQYNKYDNIGFNPTQNQSEFGTPRNSPYGYELKATPPMGGVAYYPTSPFVGIKNYIGAQGFGHAYPDILYAETSGYTGIAPLELQPLIGKPYPYQKR